MSRILRFLSIFIIAVMSLTVSAQQTRTCRSCSGSGRCVQCSGTGYGPPLYIMGGWQAMPCVLCSGTGVCYLCKGAGVEVIYQQPAYAPVYTPSSGNSGSSSSSGSQSGGTCTVCNGLGCRTAVSYENDPSGAAFYLRDLVQHSEGSRCGICGRYSYHCHMKCYKCNGTGRMP